MTSLAIKHFQQDIINYVNSVKLPMECKRLVLAEVLKQVESVAEDEINHQIQEERHREEMEKIREDMQACLIKPGLKNTAEEIPAEGKEEDNGSV